MTAWDWPGAVVTAVIDGDTLDARLSRDVGFSQVLVTPVRLRLNRINAPALHSPSGLTAHHRLVQLTAEDVHVRTIEPYKYGGPKNACGEWMAEVTTADGRNVSDVLVAEGLAVYWDGTGPRPADGLVTTPTV